MKEIMLIGKSVLGENGFCLVPEKMKDTQGKDILNLQLEKIKEASGREVLSTTAMTSKEDLEEVNYDYIPSVVMYNPSLRSLVTPEEIYLNQINNFGLCTPNVDFIIWDSLMYPLTVFTYSKTAPIIYIESKNGVCCLGTILKDSLVNHGIYTFEKIIKCMRVKDDSSFDLAICSATNKHYDDIGMTLYDYIQSFVLDIKEIRSCRYIYNTDLVKDCYSENDQGNHVILIK